MTAAEILGPAYSYLLEHGKKPTKKQIASDTGIGVNRLSQIAHNPNVARVAELRALTQVYKYHITI